MTNIASVPDPKATRWAMTRRRRLWPCQGSVPKCSLPKYGFWASGVRTGASAKRAETGLLAGFLSSVLKPPSQEVRRELAFGERFPTVPAPGQSTGLRRKSQETCHSARRPISRRARLVWELAGRDEPEIDGLCKPIGPLSDAGATRQTAMDHFGPLTSPRERIGGEGSPKSLKSPNHDNLPCAFSAQISTSTEMQ